MSDSSQGLAGALKVGTAIAVLVLAALSVLMVFDVVTMEDFKSLAMKTLLSFAIVGAAGGVFALLMRPKG